MGLAMNKEDISALVDDEVEPARLGGLLDELAADHGLQQTWGRYHLIGDVLRSRDSSTAGVASEAAAPRHLHVASHGSGPARGTNRRPLLAWGLAAGMAALALTAVLRTPLETPPIVPTGNARTSAPALVVAADNAANTATRAVRTVSASGTQRLQGYLVNFNEQRARLGVPGVHPYVRIVGFEPR